MMIGFALIRARVADSLADSLADVLTHTHTHTLSVSLSLSLQLQKLRDRGVALVHADELQHETFPRKASSDSGSKPVHKVLPVSMDVTSVEFAYIRIHRRTGFEDRRLSRVEIDRWRDRIATIASQLDDDGLIFVFWGTEHRNEPLNNAKNLVKALDCVPGVVVAVPSTPLPTPKSIDRFFPFMGIQRMSEGEHT